MFHHSRCPRSVRILLTAACLLTFVALRPDAARAQTALTATVDGVVVDPDGGAIVRAHVRVLDDRGETIARGLTDERGRFRVPYAETSCRVEVSLTGFAPATEACAATELRVTLAPARVQESIVVSATRDVAPTSQIGSAITVFTAEDIERRGAPLLGELLRSVPAVTVVRSGGLGNQTSVFTRGGDSSYNKILLDGIPLNEPGGTFNFGNLTTEHLERVEIVRGAESALFGSDAMSSVIQLFTRQAGARRAEGGLRAEGGTHQTLRASATASARVGGSDASVAVARLATDNHVPNNVLANTTASWNAGLPIGGSMWMRAVGRVEDERVGTPGATAFGRPDSDAAFTRRDVTAGVTFAHSASAFKQRMSYAYSRSRQISTNLVEDAPYTPRFGDHVGQFEFFDFLYDSRNLLERHHAGWQLDLKLVGRGRLAAAHFLTTAIEWDGERAVLDNRMSQVTVPASRDNVGWTIQHQMVVERTTVTWGARVERNASFGTAVVPRISAVHVLRRGGRLAGETTLRASAGGGVKEPTILQSFSPASSFLGNPDLEPERSRAVSAGVEQRVADGRAKIDVTWFDHRYRNQISTRTISFTPFVAQYFNIGLTTARGVELSGTVAPIAALHVRAGYTFLASKIVESTSPSSPVFRQGQWAFRRPRHSGFVDLGWSGSRLDLALTGIFTGTRVDSDFVAFVPAITSAAAQNVWTASARYRMLKSFDVTLRVENLTDARYMEPLGFPAWGRSVHAAVRVKF